MKSNLILLFFIFFSLGSCISDEESARQVGPALRDNWYGNFTGDHNGSVRFVVLHEGTIAGEITYVPSNEKELINGYLNFNGKFDMSTKSKLSFSGYLKGTKTEGKWTKNNLKGSFSFQKQ
ncbi:hypothetical protein ODZ84_12250 [Chryseobacterium fluminis]|uniref:hypothetical protein n=1 Tax=Chryseobacterium fluminis TaxID=2983606 RepID=UPI00225BEFE1|nr:hypothetical protein [Chryseobacterium sp. MMS21-Ot14]UZT96012.1 hypothetical protein ODZ84_12250 [Chryseobacterium sp. MMS21-Ot14]